MNKDASLKSDEVRKIIWGLSRKRAKLQVRLSSPPLMIEECLHKIYKKCGNPKCYCATGKKTRILSCHNLKGTWKGKAYLCK